MTTDANAYAIDTLAALEALYDVPGEISLRKEVPYLHPVYQALIAASPFAVLATIGLGGLDTSPRGDPPGFVQVLDEHTLLMPERKGNNRIDTLRNIVTDPRVALLFLIPGAGETLRVNGRAHITVAPELLERFSMQGKLPKCVLRVSVDTVFFQCARAIHRSRLWEGLPAERRAQVPSAGAIVEALTNCDVDAATYDDNLPARQQASLY